MENTVPTPRFGSNGGKASTDSMSISLEEKVKVLRQIRIRNLLIRSIVRQLDGRTR